VFFDAFLYQVCQLFRGTVRVKNITKQKRQHLSVANVAGSGKSSNFHADIEAVMDAKSIDQYNFSFNKSFQTITPL